jgi:hypothetical protein
MPVTGGDASKRRRGLGKIKARATSDSSRPRELSLIKAERRLWGRFGGLLRRATGMSSTITSAARLRIHGRWRS